MTRESRLSSPFGAIANAFMAVSLVACSASDEASSHSSEVDAHVPIDRPSPPDPWAGCSVVRSDGACLDPRPNDQDGDGYLTWDDCDDTADVVHPGAYDYPCNLVDEDCSGADTCGADNDGDGFGAHVDCDDGNSAVYPGAAEVACNGVDENCGGFDECDGDGDGADAHVDCDDSDAARHPLATETVCDDVDQDCNGSDCCAQDFDGDGFSCRVDCNDTLQRIYPGAETPPGCYYEDRNCDGTVDGVECS